MGVLFCLNLHLGSSQLLHCELFSAIEQVLVEGLNVTLSVLSLLFEQHLM